MTEQHSSPQDHDSPILSTGDILFKVQREEGIVEHRVDLLELKLTCEECEKTHALETDAEGRMKPTAAFLRDLSGRLEQIGVCQCTPTIAYKMWVAGANAMVELKNAISGMPN